MFGWVLNTLLGMNTQTNVIFVFALASGTSGNLIKDLRISPEMFEKIDVLKTSVVQPFFVKVIGVL